MSPTISSAMGAVPLDGRRTRFRVWAPRAHSVAVRILDVDRPPISLSKAEGGHYETIARDVDAGALYFYRIDDAIERPDPASRFQPQGVHGPSQVVSPDFDWTDHAWRNFAWEDYIIYEAHVGAFTPEGTFDAAIGRLDDLVELGVTALQLMPVAQFPGSRNWGYDGTYPFAVQNSYGGPAGLRRLVDACHARGLAVVLDVVYNHLGPEGNYLHSFGHYFTNRYRTPWGEAVNFDGPGSDAVREYFISNAIYWLDEFHLDALRLDATHAIFDRTARHFLRELAERVDAWSQLSGRRAYLIAENNADDPRIISAPAIGGFGLDAQLVDDFQRSLHAVITGEREGFYADFGRLEDFAKAYRAGFVLTGGYSQYRECHWGADGSRLPADKYVAYAQCHDTVGNRPDSERLGRLVDFESLKLAAAATILAPSIPLLFMGEEYDELAPFHYFVDHGDPQLCESVRQGRLREFAAFHWKTAPPDPHAVETFARSRLDWSLRSHSRHAALLRLYRRLLRIRQQTPAVRQFDRRQQQVDVMEEQRVVIARRWTEGSEIWLCFHFGGQQLALNHGLPTGGPWRVAIDTASDEWDGPGCQRQTPWTTHAPLELAPRSCLLLVADSASEPNPSTAGS